MKLGFFTMPIHPLDKEWRQCLREDREAFILADELGYTEGYVGEHATDKAENITSCAIFIGTLVDATKRIKLGTGTINMPNAHPVATASQLAMLDHLLDGRFIFGIGGGWNAEEMADHGTAFATRFKLMRERIEAMKEIWTRSKPKYAGELVKFDEMMQWPKPVQKPHPPIIVGGGFPQGARRAVAYADGWMPIGGRGGDTLAMLPPFREMLKAAGRAESAVPVTLFGVGMNGEGLKRARDAGVDRVVLGIPPEAKDKVLPLLDKGAALMREI